MSHRPSDVDSERRAAEDEAERASLMQALDGVEGHFERLVHGAYWVSQQPGYRENPDRWGGFLRADPERLLFAALWPDGIPSTFPDPARPWDLDELGYWFAETALARGIEPGPEVERRHESRGRSGKLSGRSRK